MSMDGYTPYYFDNHVMRYTKNVGTFYVLGKSFPVIHIVSGYPSEHGKNHFIIKGLTSCYGGSPWYDHQPTLYDCLVGMLIGFGQKIPGMLGWKSYYFMRCINYLRPSNIRYTIRMSLYYLQIYVYAVVYQQYIYSLEGDYTLPFNKKCDFLIFWNISGKSVNAVHRYADRKNIFIRYIIKSLIPIRLYNKNDWSYSEYHDPASLISQLDDVGGVKLFTK